MTTPDVALGRARTRARTRALRLAVALHGLSLGCAAEDVTNRDTPTETGDGGGNGEDVPPVDPSTGGADESDRSGGAAGRSPHAERPARADAGLADSRPGGALDAGNAAAEKPTRGCQKNAGASSPFPGFAMHEMGTWGTKMGQTSLVDVDRDGDLDFISGTRGSLSWWRYDGAGKWQRFDLGAGQDTDVGGVAVDIDADGFVDQVSGDSWFRNLRNGQFQRHVFGGIPCHDMRAADLDGDGRPEIISLSDRQPTIALYRVAADSRGLFAVTRFGSTVHAGLATGDIDGDADVDIVRGKVWYENQDGRGTRFVEHPIPYAGSKSTASGVGDFDGDGDLDVALSDHDGGRVAWMENRDGRGRTWLEHTLATDKRVLHSLQVADFDNDCAPDIYAGETEGKQFIWQNVDGKGGFREHPIADGAVGHETRTGDVDADGDIDLVAKPWNGGRHVFFQNLLIP